MTYEKKSCLNCCYRMGKTEDNKSIICEIDRKIREVTYCDYWREPTEQRFEIRKGSWEYLAEKSKKYPDIIEIRECIEIPRTLLILCKKGSLEEVQSFRQYIPLGIKCIFKETKQ